MNPKWAEENLQTIRTLMERSAIYRRALAPIMIFVGVTGILGGLVGNLFFPEVSLRIFALFWFSIAAAALTGSFVIIRRQALKASESFWSPPTRRVTQSLLPAFLIGFIAMAGAAISGGEQNDQNPISRISLVLAWTWSFGCAIHAASFFMVRGMKVFSWFFIAGGCLLFMYAMEYYSLIDYLSESSAVLNIVIYSFMRDYVTPHTLMGATFGGLHLAYGIYLYFTEQKNPVA